MAWRQQQNPNSTDPTHGNNTIHEKREKGKIDNRERGRGRELKELTSNGSRPRSSFNALYAMNKQRSPGLMHCQAWVSVIPTVACHHCLNLRVLCLFFSESPIFLPFYTRQRIFSESSLWIWKLPNLTRRIYRLRVREVKTKPNPSGIRSRDFIFNFNSQFSDS